MLPTNVTDEAGLSHKNLGDDNFSFSNAIEPSSSQHETIVDDTLAILESNLQADEQKLLESNFVDDSSSKNPMEDENNVQIDVNSNANNSDLKVSYCRENNCVNLENPVSDANTHTN